MRPLRPMRPMPEYSLAAIVTLALAAAIAAARGVLGERAVLLGLGVFALATVLADLVLTGLPIVTYGDVHRSGIGIGPMPIEDLVYGLALYLLAAATWGPRRSSAPAPRSETTARARHGRGVAA